MRSNLEHPPEGTQQIQTENNTAAIRQTNNCSAKTGFHHSAELLSLETEETWRAETGYIFHAGLSQNSFLVYLPQLA